MESRAWQWMLTMEWEVLEIASILVAIATITGQRMGLEEGSSYISYHPVPPHHPIPLSTKTRDGGEATSNFLVPSLWIASY